MELSSLKKLKLPDAPGVYFFLGARKEILYIGKATSLAHRVRSYFDAALKDKRSVLIEKMVGEAKSVQWVVSDSVLEAMLLEANLIRTHRPTYNTRLKDNKSFNHVVITREEFPRMLIVRGKDLLTVDEDTYTDVYGPFPSGMLFKEALRIIRKLFQVYDKHAGVSTHMSKMRKGKIDFNTQIGLYPESTDKKEYARTIRHIKLLFEGKKKEILKDLTKEMFAAAKKEEFEKANTLKKKIFALKHIQDVALIKDESRTYTDDTHFRIEAYDVAHLQGDAMVGVMTVCEGGEPARGEYRKFAVRGFTKANDPGALGEIFTRRLTHPEWRLPALIVVDGNAIQKNVIEKILKTHGLHIPVVGVVKDERHKPTRILGARTLIERHKMTILHANAEAHRFAITFHKQKRRIVK